MLLHKMSLDNFARLQVKDASDMQLRDQTEKGHTLGLYGGLHSLSDNDDAGYLSFFPGSVQGQFLHFMSLVVRQT